MTRIADIIAWFEENMPVAESELSFMSPYQLVVAVILSAQCTDKRVNIVTPPFFEKYPDAEALSEASFEDVYALVKSVSYPNNKARHLIGMAKMLVEKYGGIVPDSIDELQNLPGVGRKTANVVASIVYNKPVIAVDTHVFRVAHRLGLSNGANPIEVERDITPLFPVEKRAKAHHWLILHGRYVCTARKPKCGQCGLSQFCPSALESTL